jgi:hypothetical protein
MKFYISLIIITILITTIAFAQQCVAIDTMKTKGYHRKTLPDSTINHLLQRAKITPQLEEKLKIINVDIRSYFANHEKRDEQCQAVLYDLVIFGKVINIVDLPGPESEMFHTKVDIQIFDVLRGPKQQGDTLQIMQQGGPIISDIHPGERMTLSLEPRFTIGDLSVFFLINVQDAPDDIYLKHIHKSNFSQLLLKYPKPVYWASGQNKHDIINSYVNYFGRYIPIEQFISKIKQVAQIVDQP